MRISVRWHFAGIICFLASLAAAQSAPESANTKTGIISGRLLDGNKTPIAYATVTLLRSDSTVASGALSGEDGRFQIANTGFGSFILRINAIGFQTLYESTIQVSPQQQEVVLRPITLNTTDKRLSEVQVTGERAAMEIHFDKRVFNVEKNLTATGGNATDVLKNVPSLAVDVDGDILLRGKESTILIDGKPATLLGGDVASALNSLPASSIQSVEVITNPSARYDAQGPTGIINIITKKDQRFGFNGNASIGAGTRDKYNASLGLNLRNDRWNLFLNSNYRLNRNYARTRNERFGTSNDLVSGSYEDIWRAGGGFFNTLGAEWTISSRSSLTLTQNMNQMLWGNTGVTDFILYNNGERTQTQTRFSDNIGRPLASSTSLDWKQKFRKPRRELTANATYARTWVRRTQEFETSIRDQNGGLSRAATVQKAPGNGGNASFNAQADFTTPWQKAGKLDAGVKTQLFWFETHNNATIDSGKGPVRDLTLQNSFDYGQQVYAAYVSASNQIGKLGYQAGLRGEYAFYQGTAAILTGRRYSTEFLNLFPSAFVSYKLSDQQTVLVSYTRRVNRPSFFQLMPFVDVSNPQDTSVGNPGLIPEFTHNSEFSYNQQFKKGHSFLASAYLQYTENLIERIRRFYQDGTSYQQPRNLAEAMTYGAEFTGKAQLLPTWDASLNVNFFKNRILGTNIDPSLDNSGTSWFTKFSSNLKLPKGFSMQANGTYEAAKVAAQGRTLEVWWLDLALRKNLWNGKANIVLTASDVFNTRKYTTNYNFPNAFQTIYRDRETRIGNITFSWRFGRSEPKSPTRRNRDAQGVPVKERDNLKGSESEGGGGF